MYVSVLIYISFSLSFLPQKGFCYIYIYIYIGIYTCTRLKRLANKARDAGNDLAKLKEQEAWLREGVYKQEAANLSKSIHMQENQKQAKKIFQWLNNLHSKLVPRIPKAV